MEVGRFILQNLVLLFGLQIDSFDYFVIDPKVLYSHDVLREGSCLIAADAAGRPKGLDRLKILDQNLQLAELLGCY